MINYRVAGARNADSSSLILEEDLLCLQAPFSPGVKTCFLVTRALRHMKAHM